MTESRLGSIVHATPGRIRLRLDRPNRTAETYAQIEGLLGMLPGVAAIETNQGTGSILIRYDPAKLDVENLLRMGAELGWVPPTGAGSRPGVHGMPKIDRARVAKGVALLGVAGLGGIAGRAIGLSARLATILSSVAFVMLEKRFGRTSRKA